MRRARITAGGRISLPAEIRRRWQTAVVALEDRGDSVVVRPLPDDPIAAARGALPGRVGRTAGLRKRARAHDAAAARRR